MSRRPALRARDIEAAAAALARAGITPTALDARPDGTLRWHFTPVGNGDETDLDRELADFEAKHHGHG